MREEVGLRLDSGEVRCISIEVSLWVLQGLFY